jgi:hypothetical protein
MPLLPAIVQPEKLGKYFSTVDRHFSWGPHLGKLQIERYARFPARSSRIDFVQRK